MDPFLAPYPLFGGPKPEKGGFRGVSIWGSKNGTFSEMSKMSLFGLDGKLSTRAHARASVIYGKRPSKGVQKGVTFGVTFGPLFGPFWAIS